VRPEELAATEERGGRAPRRTRRKGVSASPTGLKSGIRSSGLVRGCGLLVDDSKKGRTAGRGGGGGRMGEERGEWERRTRDKSRTRGDQIKVTNK